MLEFLYAAFVFDVVVQLLVLPTRFDWIRVITRVLTFDTRKLELFLSLYCQQGPSKACRTTVQKQYHTRDHAVVLNVITHVIQSLAQLD